MSILTNPHRYYLAVAKEAAQAVRQLFAYEWGIEGFNELRVGLSPASDPTAEPTFYAASFVCSEQMRQALQRLESDGVVSGSNGIFYARCDSETGVVEATNFPAAQDRIGRQWDMDTALSIVGLTFSRPEGYTMD